MKRIDWIRVFFLIVFYLSILFIFHREIFTYRFDTGLVDRYLRSQDITHDVPGRVFLSDSDIHIASGYLYIKGNDPVQYNFQHPPLMKYLFGLSIVLFHNPYVVQVMMGCLLIAATYMLAIKMFHHAVTATVAALLLTIDPLFLYLSGQALLDLGQSVILLLYIYSILYLRKKYIVQGIFLGLFAASKFWAPVLLFVPLFMMYAWYKKQLNIKYFISHLIIACFVFSLMYFKTFIDHRGVFNIVFFELKTVKYWLNHSVASQFGASLFLFFTGFMQSWWGKKSIAHSDTWSILWPASLIVLLGSAYTFVRKRIINEQALLTIIPILYLCYLGAQAPFTRYFILILPLTYILFVHFFLKRFMRK